MVEVRNWRSINKYWVIGNLCALLVGTGTRVVLSNKATNPILKDSERLPAISHLAHYLFHPVTYVLVAVLLVIGVIRLRCVGFWSILFSFIVGGITATVILELQ
jgi:cytochrome b561